MRMKVVIAALVEDPHLGESPKCGSSVVDDWADPPVSALVYQPGRVDRTLPQTREWVVVDISLI